MREVKTGRDMIMVYVWRMQQAGLSSSRHVLFHPSAGWNKNYLSVSQPVCRTQNPLEIANPNREAHNSVWNKKMREILLFSWTSVLNFRPWQRPSRRGLLH
jgi:hypothetical protein